MDQKEKFTGTSVCSITFSHGVVSGEDTAKFQCKIVPDAKNIAAVGEIAVRYGEKHIFVGRSDGNPPGNHYVVIRNRKTNSVRLFANERFLLFPSKPYEGQSLITEESVSKTTRRHLQKTLGSKKVKRYLAQSEDTDVNTSNIEKSMKNAVEHNNDFVIDSTIIASPESTVTYLPPCNWDAKLINEVYKIEDLVSTEILNELDGFAEEIMRANDVSQFATDSRLSPFFLKAVVHVTKDLLSLKLLLFADSLLKFLKEPIRVLKSRTPVTCTYSTAINKKILDEFCVSSMDGIKNRSPFMRDKTLCYILVILFIVFNFRVDISLLSGNMSISELNRLPMLMKAIGARGERNMSTIFHLKLPLNRTPVNAGRMKGFKKNR